MPYLGAKELKASDIRRFDVTGSTSATHTLTWTAPNEQSLIVTINGVKQHEDAYSVSGTTLTLSSALVSTDKLEVIGINDIGTTITPAQGSVNADKLNTTGTASSSTFLRGDMAWTAVSDVSGLSSVQVFTSSGTWTRPTGITKIKMELQGAGGGGSGNSTYYGYAASGAYAVKFLDVSSISSATITVGAGGTASNTGTGADGDTIWSDGTNTITAGGGGGKNGSGQTGSSAGTATGGDVNISGCRGSARNSMNIPHSHFGFTGGFTGLSGNDTYSPVTGYGAGGTVGYGPNSEWPKDGGDGLVIVWEYK